MEGIGVWISPLLLLPGAALLILSTSNRYGGLDSEIHDLILNRDEDSLPIAHHLLKRSIMLRHSLTLLYMSVGFFSLGGLLGGVTSIWGQLSYRVTIALTCCGIFSLLVASFQLIRESMLSLEILRNHVRQLEKS
jgi:hypothetical protein